MQTRQRLAGGTFIRAFISSASASSKDSNINSCLKKIQMCFGEEKENLSFLRWEEGMATMVLINIKPSSPSLLLPCP